ncbi:MAG: hypothetical protein Q9O24_13605 [Gammaproteobacteria bacterium]|nr:hypothetical protein [Gammaproteobacteria bacterium]MDQ7076146.1 hypothetical protein [Gammaproteobacteria bacterium]
MQGNSTTHNRLLLAIDNQIKKLNREIISPQIPQLVLNELKPIMSLVAKARAAYLKELFVITEQVNGEVTSPQQIEKLRDLRTVFEELVQATQALETAIERGYLEVSQK